MKSYHVRLVMTVMLITVIGLLLTACGGGEEPTPVPEVVNTPVPPPPTDEPAPPPTDIPPTETPAPTATSEPEVGADFIPYESAEGGFSLRYPDGWFTNELFGFAMFASHEELLDAPDPGEEGGIAVVLAGDVSEYETSDPVALLNTASADMDITPDAEITEGPTAVTINGQDAATAVIKGTSDSGTPLAAFITVIINGDRVAIVMAVTPAESEAEYRPIFDAITNSVEVGVPTAPVVDIPDVGPSEGVLLYGDTKTGTIPADGSAAWDFIGLEGETIDIIVRPQADELDAVFDVLDESGTSILDSEIDDSFGDEELRDFTLPSSGTFTIFIRGFAGSGGDYEVTLAEAGAAAGSSTEGAIDYGDLMTGSIVSGESASWSFVGQANSFIDITVIPYEFDLTVDVLDPSGISVLDESPMDGSFDTEFIRTLSLPEDGTYTIVVSGYEDEFGDYDISLGLSNDGQPGSIVFAYDTLEESETEDGHAFPFTAPADEVVKFYVDPEFGFDLVIDIVNDDTDETLDSIDLTTGFEEAVFTVPELANYYFLVKGFEGSFGQYDATLLGSDYVIFDLAVGDRVIGRFGADGLIDYFYQGRAGDTVTFTAETNDDLDLVLKMTDLDDNSLMEVDEFVAGGTETLTYTFTEDLSVFLTVSEFDANPGQFTLTVDAQ